MSSRDRNIWGHRTKGTVVIEIEQRHRAAKAVLPSLPTKLGERMRGQHRILTLRMGGTWNVPRRALRFL